MIARPMVTANPEAWMTEMRNDRLEHPTIRAAGATHVGYQRERNEDRFGVFEDVGLIYVADGMGGYFNGHVASRIAGEAVERAAEKIRDAGEEPPVREVFELIMKDAHQRMVEQHHADGHEYGLGTMLTAAWFRSGGKVHILHIGDTRGYLFRAGNLIPLTRDHSVVGEAVERGELTREQARRHPLRNLVTRYLGSESWQAPPDVYNIGLRPGDRLLLASDGLTDMVPEAKIEELCREHENPEELVERLVAEALAAGGEDNVTVVVADLVSSGAAPRPRSDARRGRRRSVSTPTSLR